MSGGRDLLTRAIDTLAGGRDLGLEDTAAVLGEIMAGHATEIQIAAFLIALRTKGETVAEVVGLARTMRAFATPVRPERGDLIDTAGTGGGLRTFNVSLGTSVSLAPHAPAGSILVSESGIGGARDVSMLSAHGFRAFLVGETLMRAGEPEETLRSLVGSDEGSARD